MSIIKKKISSVGIRLQTTDISKLKALQTKLLFYVTCTLKAFSFYLLRVHSFFFDKLWINCLVSQMTTTYYYVSNLARFNRNNYLFCGQHSEIYGFIVLTCLLTISNSTLLLIIRGIKRKNNAISYFVLLKP